MATVEDVVLAAAVADLRREVAALKAKTDTDRAVLKTILRRHERELAHQRASMMAVLDACHALTETVATLKGRVDALTTIDTVH